MPRGSRKKGLQVVTASPHLEASEKSLYADQGEVTEWAKSLPERFLHCREMNHNWKPFQVGSHKDGGYERTLRCVRCKTKKIQHLDTHGMLIGSGRYEWPEGYKAEGIGRIVGEGRGALRIESILRIVGDAARESAS